MRELPQLGASPRVQSSQKSGDGKQRVSEVADLIRAITEQAESATTLVREVNLGSQEQARGIDQIARTISQMQQVTQQSAATAEQSAAAAQDMASQAQVLQTVVANMSALIPGSVE